MYHVHVPLFEICVSLRRTHALQHICAMNTLSGVCMLLELMAMACIAASYPLQCTAGHEGVLSVPSSQSISAYFQGLQTPIQLPATTWSAQIWISGWILPHFNVKTISVPWKLKESPNIFGVIGKVFLVKKYLITSSVFKLQKWFFQTEIQIWADHLVAT